MQTVEPVLPILLFIVCVAGLAIGLLVVANLLSPGRTTRVKEMPYESGMDPIHDTRRRFDIRFHLLAIAFLVFDVELLFLYPWAVVFHRPVGGAPPAVQAVAAAPGPGLGAAAPAVAATRRDGLSPELLFGGGMVFIGLLALGFVYDWRKGIFEWR